MAITYNWNFNPIEVEFSSASLSNVATCVHWRYTATTEGTSSLGVSGSFYGKHIGVEALGAVASADFVAYDSLTKDIVTGWVTASLGDERVTEIQTDVSKSIAGQLNPPMGKKQAPW